MGGAEQEQTPSEKLLQALQAYVQDVAGAPAYGQPAGAAGHDPPTWKDVLLLLVFVCDLALIVWSVPEEWLKSTQLEFLQKLLPVIGGGGFTLLAAWYKDKTLQWTQSRRFKLCLIPITAIAVVLTVPILPVRIVAYPEDAIVYLDKPDDDHLRDWKRSFRVKLGNHAFILKHHEDQDQPLTPIFERNLAQLVSLFVFGEPLEINLVCPYRFYSPNTHGITVDITPKRGTFSKDFLRDDLLKNGGLQKINERTLRLNPRSADDASEPTQLPAGEYTAIASKGECTPSDPQPFTVHPARHADRKYLEFPRLTCPQ